MIASGRLRLAMLAAAVACAVAGCSKLRDPVGEKVAEGYEHYTAGRYPEALAAWRDAGIDAPDDPRIAFDAGDALYRQGDYAGAEEAFSRAQSSGDTITMARAAYNIGNSRFRREDLAGAAEAYERSLSLDPRDREAKFNLELVQLLLEKAAQPGGGNRESPRASEWARQRAAQAEELAQQGRYPDADALMARTFAAEPTARNEFGDFAKRLHDLAEVFGGNP